MRAREGASPSFEVNSPARCVVLAGRLFTSSVRPMNRDDAGGCLLSACRAEVAISFWAEDPRRPRIEYSTPATEPSWSTPSIYRDKRVSPSRICTALPPRAIPATDPDTKTKWTRFSAERATRCPTELGQRDARSHTTAIESCVRMVQLAQSTD